MAYAPIYHPLASPEGVAERSESFKIMIAGGNHSTVERWLSVSETGGVCSSTERFKKTPQSDLSVPKCRQICQLQLCIKHLYAINGYSC